jgi:cytochrome c biogenesis protein CcmG/thiol:disulfide interchange protein DsbE
MTGKRSSDWFPLLAFAALIAVFIYAFATGHDPKYIPSVLISREAPEFELTGVDGKIYESDDVFEHRVTVVNFFASWCAPCRAEHPLIVDLARTHNVRIIGIAYKDQLDKTKKYLLDLGDPYNLVLRDERGRVGIDWGITGVPETFIVDKSGHIRYHFAGVLTDVQISAIADIVKNLEQS